MGRLLAVVLISLGIMMQSNAQEVVKNTSLKEELSSVEQQEIQEFNSKWESYQGSETASEVMSMYQQVIANNTLEYRLNSERYVNIIGNENEKCSELEKENESDYDDVKDLKMPNISSNKKYIVKLVYDSNNSGRVVAICWGLEK